MDSQGGDGLKSLVGGAERAVSRWDLLACALPLCLITAMLGIYFADRDFYLTYVIEPLRREYQAVEIGTFLFLMFSIPWLLIASRQQWARRHEPGGWQALTVIVLVLGATVFAFGEEVDWGDTFFHWTAEGSELEDVYALNVHNNLSVKGIGSAFLFAVFFALPLAWAGRDRWKLAAGLRPAVPEWPVVFAMAVAFGWRLFKHIYVAIVGKENLGEYGDDGFYWGFVEQNNEHKEMLIAAAIFLYALYRIRATRRPAAISSPSAV
jgi:hypothetical protein